MAGMAMKNFLVKSGQLALAQRIPAAGLRALVTNSTSGPFRTGSPEESANEAVDAVSGDSTTTDHTENSDDSRNISTATARVANNVNATANNVNATANKAVWTTQEMSEKAKQTVANSANTTANQTIDTVDEISEKAKQTVQDVWGSAKASARHIQEKVMGKAEEGKRTVKEAADTVQETVIGKAEEGKQTIKETADTVKHAMNSKNVR